MSCLKPIGQSFSYKVSSRRMFVEYYSYTVPKLIWISAYKLSLPGLEQMRHCVYAFCLYLHFTVCICIWPRNLTYTVMLGIRYTSAPSAFMWTVYKFPKSCRYYCILYTVYLPSAWITFTNCSLFLPAANLFYSLWKCINFLYNLNFQPYCISHLEKVKYFRLFFYWTFNFFFCFTGFISLKDRT